MTLSRTKLILYDMQDCSEEELEELSRLISFLEKRTKIRQVQMLKHAVAMKYRDQDTAVQALHVYFDSPASKCLTFHHLTLA